MTILPFLLLGVGAVWVGLMVAMSDRRVAKPYTITLKADVSGLRDALWRSARRMQEMADSMRRVSEATQAARPHVEQFGERMRERPLSSPREPSEQEARFVREQAAVYNAVLKDDPFTTLIPACMYCGSADLIEDHATCSFVCNVCRKASSSDDIRAGRIAR